MSMQRETRWTTDDPRQVGGYLSVKEAAQAAGVSHRALVKAIARGQLSAVIGHPTQPSTWIVHSQDLETWLGRPGTGEAGCSSSS
jgi:hypothetical protein